MSQVNSEKFIDKCHLRAEFTSVKPFSLIQIEEFVIILLIIYLNIAGSLKHSVTLLFLAIAFAMCFFDGVRS